MSDTARPKAYGELLSAAEVNADLPIVLTTGTPISSTPLAIYISNDGKVYIAGGPEVSVRANLNFIGFAVTVATSGSPTAVQLKGSVNGFSGLTAGRNYYLSNIPGMISSTPSSTYEKKIGIAIATDTLLIINEEANITTIASATLQNSNDTSKTTQSTSYVKLKEIKLNDDILRCRVGFDLSSDSAGQTALARIYKNGVAIGAVRSKAGAVQTFQEDFIGFFKDDLIQIYAAIDNASFIANITNMRLYYDREMIVTPNFSITNQDP